MMEIKKINGKYYECREIDIDTIIAKQKESKEIIEKEIIELEALKE